MSVKDEDAGKKAQCPVCGNYVARPAQALSGKPIWYVVLAVAGIIAVIWLLSGLVIL